jgi:hypothetical protein
MEKPSSSSNPQSDITSEEHLKILLRILSTKIFTITSLFSLREYALHVWEFLDPISVRTPTARRNYRRRHFILQRAGFNPHLPAPFILTKSGPKSDLGPTRKSGKLLFLEDKRLSLGRRGRKGQVDRRLYLV